MKVGPSDVAVLVAQQHPCLVTHEKTIESMLVWIYNSSTGIWDLGDVVISRLVEAIHPKASGFFKREVLRHLADSSPEKSLQDFNMRNSLSLVPLANGVYDIDNGSLRQYALEDYWTFKYPVGYVAGATAPRFWKFLSEVMAPDDVEVTLDMMGYTPIRHSRFRAGWIGVGSGKNGKSVLLHTMIHLFGEDNVSGLPIQELGIRFKNQYLLNKTANIYADLPAQGIPDTSTIKNAMGGDWIDGEPKYRDTFFFWPWAKFWFSCNKLPSTSDYSMGFYDRWRVVEFPNIFDGEREDPRLRDKLLSELPGIMLITLERMRKVLTIGGVRKNKTSEQVKDRWEADIASAALFIERMIVTGCQTPALKDDVYGAYCDWCQRMSVAPENKISFCREMNRRVQPLFETQVGLEKRRAWVGIGVRAHESVPESKPKAEPESKPGPLDEALALLEKAVLEGDGKNGRKQTG